MLLAQPAALLYRTALVAALPGTAVLFSALGLPVNLLGLTFESVTSSLSHETGAAVLIVTGTIANVAARPVRVPPLAIAVEGGDGEPLYRWSVEAGAGELPAGQRAAFKARLASPPPAGRHVEVTFREPSRLGQVALR